MPIRQVKISFHRVEVTNEDTPVSFGKILSDIEKVPNDRRRTALISDEPVRLRYLHRSGTKWLGDLARIRLHEAIDKSTTDGEEAEIRFREDEGPCEKTAFLYDQNLRILAIQHPGGVSPSSCARYFRSIGNVRKIEMPVILKLEALERILRFGSATKFQVRLARIDNARPLRGIDVSARRMMEFLRSLRAPTASINIGLDKNGSPLDILKQLVRDVMHLEQDHLADVRKILVVGADEDAPDEMTAIDLLKDRIIESVPVELADGERITDGHRYKAVRKAWERATPELEALSDKG